MKARARYAIPAGLGVLVLTLSACATRLPAPSDAVQAAELSIAKADEARGAEFAPLPLREAREKVVQARSAMERRTEEQDMYARRLAEQSQADADLAASVAQAQRAQAANDEVNRSILALKQEMQRQ